MGSTQTGEAVQSALERIRFEFPVFTFVVASVPGTLALLRALSPTETVVTPF